METYKFKTTVLQGGTFRIPECVRFANRPVEVFVVIKTPEEPQHEPSQSIEEFLNKWTGFLGDVDPDELKHQYLQEKYAFVQYVDATRPHFGPPPRWPPTFPR